MVGSQQILEVDGINGLERITVHGLIPLPIPNIPGKRFNIHPDKILSIYMGESDIEYDETEEISRSDEGLPITKKTDRRLTQRVKTFMLIPPWKEIPANIEEKNITYIDVTNPATVKLYKDIAEKILKNL